MDKKVPSPKLQKWGIIFSIIGAASSVVIGIIAIYLTCQIAATDKTVDTIIQSNKILAESNEKLKDLIVETRNSQKKQDTIIANNRVELLVIKQQFELDRDIAAGENKLILSKYQRKMADLIIDLLRLDNFFKESFLQKTKEEKSIELNPITIQINNLEKEPLLKNNLNWKIFKEQYHQFVNEMTSFNTNEVINVKYGKSEIKDSNTYMLLCFESFFEKIREMKDFQDKKIEEFLEKNREKYLYTN